MRTCFLEATVRMEGKAAFAALDEPGDGHTRWARSDREGQVPRYRLYAESKNKNE